MWRQGAGYFYILQESEYVSCALKMWWWSDSFNFFVVLVRNYAPMKYIDTSDFLFLVAKLC